MPDFAPHNMTGESAPSPYVVSGTDTAFGRYRAFDGVVTYLAPYQTDISPNPTLKIDLGVAGAQPLFAYAFKFVAYPDGDTAKAPKSWILEGSTDDLTYVQLDSQSNVTSWTLDCIKPFSASTPTGVLYRYYRFTFSAVQSGPHLKFSEIFLYNSAADVMVNRLTINTIFSFDPDPNEALPSRGIADIFFGDSTHTPGSVTEPGAGSIYSSGTQIAKHTTTSDLPLDGSGVIVPINFDNPSSADPSDAILWYSILGTVGPVEGAVNSFKIYLMYLKMELTNGVVKFSVPTTQSVDFYSGTLAGDVRNPALAIDNDTTSLAEMYRTNFSALATATQFRLSAFSEFLSGEALACGNPPNGQLGVAYSHQIPIPNGYFAPYTFSLVSPPPGLSISAVGLLSGTPSEVGTFPFTVELLDSLGQTSSVNCSISVVDNSALSVFAPSCMFEFYGLEKPENVETLPVPKKFDQVQTRFDKIGKIFGFRVRVVPTGSTTSLQYNVYSDDSATLAANTNPLYFGSFTVVPNRDNIREIQFPKSVNTDVFRLTLGPSDDAFHRYDILIKVQTSGMESESRWMPLR